MVRVDVARDGRLKTPSILLKTVAVVKSIYHLVENFASFLYQDPKVLTIPYSTPKYLRKIKNRNVCAKESAMKYWRCHFNILRIVFYYPLIVNFSAVFFNKVSSRKLQQNFPKILSTAPDYENFGKLHYRRVLISVCRFTMRVY